MVQVTVSDGILEGEWVEDELVKFYSFKGIPYATPPLGELRFKAPQPIQPWEGVRSAKEFGSSCYQFDLFTKEVLGSEDCLYLNVYTPDLKPAKPLPVMVWIHGGSFICGSGNDDIYGPEYLIRHGVILVTLNYRLEVLGFLCLESKEVPGNAGMKDQVAALRWVKNNIKYFGGDPDNVTIFGESAGGACVSSHTVSPMSKGLFNKAIAQSGSISNDWATPWGPFQAALSLAQKLGFDSDNKIELYEFFKSQPAKNLIGCGEFYTVFDEGRGFCDVKFAMAPEKDFGQERFLVGDAYDMIRVGIHEGIDVMVGFTADEGIFLTSLINDLDIAIHKIKMFDDFLVPKAIGLNMSQTCKHEAGRRIKKYYFGKEYDESEKFDQFLKFCTIEFFVYGIIQYALICSEAKKNKIYMYNFTCKSERNFMSHIFNLRKYVGDKTVVSHADDLPYLFPIKMTGTEVDKESEMFKLIDQVTKLWTNFAKHGNPTPDNSLGVKWKPYSVERQDYLEIGNQLREDVSPHAEEMELWQSIYREFYPEHVFQTSNILDKIP